MTTQTAVRPTRTAPRGQWLAPVGLILLTLIPILAGAARLTELTGGPVVTEANARFVTSPLPVITHIISATVFSLVGAFQFVPALRRRGGWHRLAGRVLIPAGLLVALSGMWMGAFSAHPAGDGPALVVLRLIFGAAMAASILLGIRAITRRDFSSHGAWMTRAYALGVAAGTQAIVLIPQSIIFGGTEQVSRAVAMGAAWVINLSVAELVIRRRRRPRSRAQSQQQAQAQAQAQKPTMLAAVYRRFGGPDVVRVENVAKPTPRPNEVLVRVHASTVSAADHRTRARDIPRGLGVLAGIAIGFVRPRRRVLGMDVSGVVESVGSRVTTFAPGDEVIAMLGASFGGHAEYVCVAQDAAIAPKPSRLSFDEAASIVFGGITALEFLNRASIAPENRVLINGASGAVGTAAVQLAKRLGAHVTGVTSGANRDLVLGLGADEVIDYTVTDFTSTGARYDVIVDCVGNAGFDRVAASINPGGSLLLVAADLGTILSAGRQSKASGIHVSAAEVAYTGTAMSSLSRLAESGLLRPVIDRAYALESVVNAHRFVDSGHKRGAVVLQVVDQ